MSLLEPPDWLPPEARPEWDRAAAQLLGRGLLDDVRHSMLGHAVQAFREYVAAVEACGTGPLTAEAETRRRLAREIAGDLYLVDAGRRLAAVGPARIDADLAAAFGFDPDSTQRTRE